jgi:hypothetical protein
MPDQPFVLVDFCVGGGGDMWLPPPTIIIGTSFGLEDLSGDLYLEDQSGPILLES